MNLKQSRDQIRAELEAGKPIKSPILDNYRKYRDTEEWRSSLLAETLCEYILYLEDKVKALEGSGNKNPQ